MARSHNLAGIGTDPNMWKMRLTLRQAKMVDSEAILKSNSS
jgi:hypothetical protein